MTSEIKAEMIPHGLALIARKAWAEGAGPTNDDDWNAAIAAALSAWPGAAVCHYTIADDEGYEMVLPLPFPQEGGDE